MNSWSKSLIGLAWITLASSRALGVIPSIQANGGGGTVTVVESNSLSLTIQLNTEGAAGPADWWLLANTGSAWYFFDAASGLWRQGFQVTHQGALVDLSSTEVLRMAGLAPGVYSIYFGVDLTPDGTVDDPLYYDLITVNAVPHDSLSELYVDVYDEAKAYNGSTYFAEAHSSPRIVAVNMQGAITWQYNVPSNLRQFTNPGFDVEVLTNNGHVLFVLPSNGVYEIDSAGTVVWSNLDAQVSHDADRLANGNTIYIFGNNDKFEDPQVKEVNAGGGLVWSWSANTAFDYEPYRSISAEGWTHANAVTRLQGGNTLVNLRNFDMTVEVNHAGAVVWSNDWSTIGGTNCDPHEPEIETNGHIVVCLQNNSPYQVVEIDKSTKELVWTYARDGLRTARDADRLPNGNTLIVGVLQPQEDSVVFEVTAEGEIVWQLKIKDAPATHSPGFFYKAQRLGAQ
ncbi:MAG: aryl-sulfate sulfotransferase [Lentisphaerae bacterium]|nr:aryl-sulfate sulfotransferase [Lentisphaerota bacterium]